MSWYPWGRHGEAQRQYMSAAGGNGPTAKDKIESFVTESTIEGVLEMLSAYPELKVGKFDPFPTDDAELSSWLDELEESQAQELCDMLGKVQPVKH